MPSPLRLAIACACLLNEHDEILAPCWKHLNEKRCHVKNGGAVRVDGPQSPANDSENQGPGNAA